MTGQKLLGRIESWIASWIVFPEMPSNQGLIMALWTMHTWFAPRWPVTAYLHITSDGPGCGKTTLMEVMAQLSCHPRLRATLRPLAVVRDIEEQAGAVTYFFDQVEALQASRKISDEQAILLTGYRHGGEHGISVGQKQMAFSTYCPKAFASIGDIARDLRSRAVIARLGFGVPTRDWSDAAMVRETEAASIKEAMASFFHNDVPAWTPPDFLSGREREIWTPLYSVALALNLDAAGTKRVRDTIRDFVEFKKTVESRSYRDLIQAEKPEERDEYALSALRDLAAVLPAADKHHTGDIHTTVAIEKMKELDGPWRAFKGTGLNPDLLAQLLSTYSVGPKEVRMVRGKSGKLLKGYSAKQVRAALDKVSGGAIVVRTEN